MDNQILEMLTKLNDSIEKGFAEVNSRIDKTNERIDDTNKRMDARFDSIDAKLTGVGQHFEELSKNNIQLRNDMKKELKYVTHKINELDREVFMRTDSPQ